MRTILLSAVTIALGCGLFKIRSRPFSLKILSAYLGLSLVSEFAAYFMARVYQNNMPVFHILSPILFILLADYFQLVSKTVKKHRLGYWFAFICLCIAVLNTLLIQPIHTMNSNYLLLEGLFACSLAFITLYDFLSDEDNVFIFRSIHFWIAVIVLFHYLCTYIAYVVIRILKISGSGSGLDLVYNCLWLVTVVTYLSLGASYLVFNDKQKTHE